MAYQMQSKTEPPAGVEVKPTVCFWCKAECGLLAYVKDGVLLKLEEDPEWPIKCYPPTAGCVRRKAAVEYFYHPGRLNYPLKRIGERGEGKWQRIEWKDALDEIADKLARLRDRYGAETLAATGGTARTHDEYRALASSISSALRISSDRSGFASARALSWRTQSLGCFPIIR